MSHLSHIMSVSQSFTHTDWFLLALRGEKEGEEGSLFHFYSTCVLFFLPFTVSCSQLVIPHILRSLFLWLNGTRVRLGACWKPQIPVFHWIWSLLRYRLIPPWALTTSLMVSVYLLAGMWLLLNEYVLDFHSSMCSTACILGVLCVLLDAYTFKVVHRWVSLHLKVMHRRMYAWVDSAKA